MYSIQSAQKLFIIFLSLEIEWYKNKLFRPFKIWEGKNILIAVFFLI